MVSEFVQDNISGANTKMEVVVLSVADADQEDDSVNDSCIHVSISADGLSPWSYEHTCAGWILSEMLCLVSTKETLWLDLWSRATRKLLVETDYSLHACGILSST